MSQLMKCITVHYLESFHTTLLLVWLVSCLQFSDTSLLMCQPKAGKRSTRMWCFKNYLVVTEGLIHIKILRTPIKKHKKQLPLSLAKEDCLSGSTWTYGLKLLNHLFYSALKQKRNMKFHFHLPVKNEKMENYYFYIYDINVKYGFTIYK